MDLSKRKFKEDFKRMLTEVYSMDITESEATEQFFTLGNLLRSYSSKNWSRTNQQYIERDRKSVV